MDRRGGPGLSEGWAQRLKMVEIVDLLISADETGGERDWPLQQFSMKPSKDIIEALEKVRFDFDADDADNDC